MKLIINCKFSKKDKYVEKDFFDVISKSLSELGREIDISSFKYCEIEGGYLFETEFEPVLPMVSY